MTCQHHLPRKIMAGVALIACVGGAADEAMVPGGGLSRNVRIVDYGNDMGSGEIFYRGHAPEKGRGEVDRDGNGMVDNDTVSFWRFSLDEPLNPPPLRYDADQKSARFYGGLTLYAVNNPQRAISEGHMNANHEFRDDFNFMGGLAPHLPDEQVEAYAVWLWQKADFWNGGDRHPVAFDPGSRIAVHITRYFGGFHGAHWVVRDGDRFYVSKASFGRYRSLTQNADDTGVCHKTHVLRPTETEWAEYHPQAPCTIDFDPAKAAFARHEFTDVTAVGWLVRRELSRPETVYPNLRPPFAVKWGAFRCDAVVRRPAESGPSHHVPMVPVGKDGFHLGIHEVTYQQWAKVWRSAVTNQYGYDLGELGYSFVRDGSMGSMRVDNRPHAADEPVTDITWMDAATFCNALSELEGKTPCYYVDPEFRHVLRQPIDRAMREKWNVRPAVHWRQDADGFRLPTLSEWVAAATADGTQSFFTANQGWDGDRAHGGTHAVGALPANAAGLHDLLGNVWEYAWDADGTVIDEGHVATHIVLGGDFQPSVQNHRFAFPERPWNGHYGLGFRIACGPAAEMPKGMRDVPVWAIDPALVLPPDAKTAMTREALADLVRREMPLVTVADAGLANRSDRVDPVIDPNAERRRRSGMAADEKFLGRITEEQYQKILAENKIEETPRIPYPLGFGRTEVPYRLWSLVKGWAEANGYAFNYAGDMGSMRHAVDLARQHSPSEPVTQISWHDAVVWCNALSEITGRTPAYCHDADGKEIYRHALLFRLDMFDARHGAPVYPWEGNTGRARGLKLAVSTGSCVRVFFDGEANGYRLPMDVEFVRADTGDPATAAAREWLGPEAADGTRQVGTRDPNPLGLHDMGGNVFEWAWDSQRPYHQIQNANYAVNGNGYFFEPYLPRRSKPAYTEYTASARPILGFRVVSRSSL